MAQKQALTLKEFNTLYDLKAYLENYSGFSIYDMKNFNTIWDLLYTEYFNVYLDFDPTNDYVETVQNSFVSFYYQWIPKLNYHFLKNADLSKELYGNIDINTIKNNPINNDAKSLKDVKDLPIFNANMNGRVDFENFYQSEFSTQIIIDYLTSARVFFILINDVENYVDNILISPYALKSLENISQLTDDGKTVDKVLYQDIDGSIKIGEVSGGGTGSSKFKTGENVGDVSISTKDAPLAPAADTLIASDLYDKDIQEIHDEVALKANTDDVYSKTAADHLFDTKANKDEVYDKTEIDTKLDDVVKVDGNQTINDNKTLTDYWNVSGGKGFKFNGDSNGFELWNMATTAGYLDIIQNWAGGTTFKSWTGMRFFRAENGNRVMGPRMLMDNNDQLIINCNGNLKVAGGPVYVGETANANTIIEPAYIKIKNGTNASLSLTAAKSTTETFTRLKENTSDKLIAYTSDIPINTFSFTTNFSATTTAINASVNLKTLMDATFPGVFDDWVANKTKYTIEAVVQSRAGTSNFQGHLQSTGSTQGAAQANLFYASTGLDNRISWEQDAETTFQVWWMGNTNGDMRFYARFNNGWSTGFSIKKIVVYKVS